MTLPRLLAKAPPTFDCTRSRSTLWRKPGRYQGRSETRGVNAKQRGWVTRYSPTQAPHQGGWTKNPGRGRAYDFGRRVPRDHFLRFCQRHIPPQIDLVPVDDIAEGRPWTRSVRNRRCHCQEARKGHAVFVDPSSTPRRWDERLLRRAVELTTLGDTNRATNPRFLATTPLINLVPRRHYGLKFDRAQGRSAGRGYGLRPIGGKANNRRGLPLPTSGEGSRGARTKLPTTDVVRTTAPGRSSACHFGCCVPREPSSLLSNDTSRL